MSKKIYRSDISCEDDLHLLRAVLKIFLLSYELRTGIKVRPKLIDTLLFYVMHGVTKESDNMMAKSSGVNLKNIRVHKTELRKKGLLVKSDTNLHTSELSEELLQVKRLFKETKDRNQLLYVFVLNDANHV